MNSPRASATDSALAAYYAATALFLALDYGFGINVRLAFLEPLPVLRAGYYGVLAACFALILWRPASTVLVAAFESLITLVALIFSMAMRSLLISDRMLESGAGLVTLPEIVNFLIAGGAAYVAWLRGVQALRGDSRLR